MTPRGFTSNANGQTVYLGYVIVGIEVESSTVGTNVFGALTLDGTQPDCEAGLRLKSGSTLFITEDTSITAKTCEDGKQSVVVSEDYVIQPAFQVLVSIALDALTSAEWTSVLQRLFRLEIASDLEMETIDLDRIVSPLKFPSRSIAPSLKKLTG